MPRRKSNFDRQDIPSIEQIRELFAPVLRDGGAKRAIVFGSYARGEADLHSDLDLIIVTDTELKFTRRHEQFIGIDEIWQKGLDMLIYTPQELAELLSKGRAFVERALDEGVVIYEE